MDGTHPQFKFAAGILIKPEALGSTPGGTNFVPPLPFQRSLNNKDQDHLLFDVLYLSSDCGESCPSESCDSAPNPTTSYT